jgi:hypothetical protein
MTKSNLIHNQVLKIHTLAYKIVSRIHNKSKNRNNLLKTEKDKMTDKEIFLIKIKTMKKIELKFLIKMIQ